MLQDPKPPMKPKETSLMTHPDASMKMYDINKKKQIIVWLKICEYEKTAQIDILFAREKQG